ncbi:hypothetical protein ACHAO7_000141 [Fusarium culmorum]
MPRRSRSSRRTKGYAIVQKINAGLHHREIDFSADACRDMPVNQIAPGKDLSLSQSIVTEIFHETGIPMDESSQQCWDKMAEKVMPRLLCITKLQYHPKWNTVMHKLDRMKALPSQGDRYAYENKNDFVEFFGKNNGMQWLPITIKVHQQVGNHVVAIELDQKAIEPKVRFEKINGMNVAIITTKKPPTNSYEAAMQAVTRRMIKGDIDVSNNSNPNTNSQPQPQPQPQPSPDRDSSCSSEQLRESIETNEPNSFPSGQSESVEICDGPSSPERSQHSTDREESQHDMLGRRLDTIVYGQPRHSIGQAEPDEVPMGSIASVIVEDSPENEPQQHQNLEPRTPDSKTLRGHARQMKALGKRLPNPDQRFVKRVRRDIRQFAKLSDQKEEEMVLERESMRSRNPPSSEHASQASGIDLFGRYKMLWKGVLRENGSIPESLRELVRHDCDSNQLFYLEETEADFLAANAMRNENPQ